MIAGLIELDRQAISALKIRDDYAIHRVVYSLFDNVRDDGQDMMPSGILYADKGGDAFSRKILFLSDRMPRQPAYGRMSVREVSESLLDYEFYRFEVVVNATQRRRPDGKEVPVQDIRGWFCEKAPSQWGFAVDAMEVASESRVPLRKDKNVFYLRRVKITGFLRVTDKDLFKVSFEKGIGRKKAFGCGLLQIVPTNFSK